MIVGRRGVIRETTNAMKEMVKGTRNGCVNLRHTITLLDLISQDQNNPLTQE
jgi:uncharacterized protein (UPF0147 family)